MLYNSVEPERGMPADTITFAVPSFQATLALRARAIAGYSSFLNILCSFTGSLIWLKLIKSLRAGLPPKVEGTFTAVPLTERRKV